MWGFSGGSLASVGDSRDPWSIPESGGSPGVGNGNPFQDSGLENPMDRGVWWATVHGYARTHTQTYIDVSHTYKIPSQQPRLVFMFILSNGHYSLGNFT